MSKIVKLIIVIGMTLAAAFATPLLMKDPGYFLIRFAGYEIEMRFIVAFALFVIAVIVFWLLVYFIRLPKKTVRSFTSNRSRKSFAKGLLSMSEGKWKQAEKQLLISAKNSPTPELSYMAAARAAVAQNKIAQAFSYLDEAELNTDNPLTVDLTRCELWVSTGDYKKAIKLLSRILKSYPNNPRALSLMTQASQNDGQWDKLREILPKVEKLAILPDDKVLQITQMSIIEQFNHCQSSSEMLAIWKSLSKKQKLELDYIQAFAENGFKLSMYDEVAQVTEKALNKDFTIPLVKIWAKLSIDSNHKIKMAEKWLKKNSDNPQLLQILGRLCLENKLWGKAQTYLQKSLEIEANAETYKYMAHYFDAIGEKDNALEAYRQAEGTKTQLVLLEQLKDDEVQNQAP